MSDCIRILSGVEREALHHRIHVHLDIGEASDSERRAADSAAADAARLDPSVLADKLGSKFGPRIARLGDGFKAQFVPSETSGTWCMLAAKKAYPRLLEVALESGIGPDDPEVFILGGLLSYESVLRSMPLLQLALRHGASYATRLQPVPHSNHWRPCPTQFLIDELSQMRTQLSPGSLPVLQSVLELMLAGARVDPPTERRGARYRNQDVVEALIAVDSALRIGGPSQHLPAHLDWLSEALDAAYGKGTSSLATEFSMRLRLVQCDAAQGPIAAAPDMETQPARRSRMVV